MLKLRYAYTSQVKQDAQYAVVGVSSSHVIREGHLIASNPILV